MTSDAPMRRREATQSREVARGSDLANAREKGSVFRLRHCPGRSTGTVTRFRRVPLRNIARIHLRPPSLAEAGVPSVGAGPEPENVRKMGARSGFERAGIFAADRGDAVDGGVEGGPAELRRQP